MKKLLPALLLVLLLTGCCKEENPVPVSTLIIGKWVNTLIDNEIIPTNQSFTLEFLPDGTENYASGFRIDDNNKTWIENKGYTYTVEGDLIVIDGSNSFGDEFHMEFKIVQCNELLLSYSVSKFLVNNVEYPDLKVYTCKRVVSDLSKSFTGTWYGRCTTPGTSDTAHHYWDYFSDGRFDYYYRDGQGNWVSKSDNQGRWFLYGDFLATNYTNDLLTGGTGKDFECWNVGIVDEKMYWSAIRDSNVNAAFEMVRVAAPPAVGGGK